MGRFTDRSIEKLLDELLMYAERANKAMCLIIDNFQLTYNEQEDTVDLTRIEHPDWYGNDFEEECAECLKFYEDIIFFNATIYFIVPSIVYNTCLLESI